MKPRTENSTTFSIELFPPKDELGESRLWEAVEELALLNPDSVSVTYGAGGSTRDRTIRIADELTAEILREDRMPPGYQPRVDWIMPTNWLT